MIIILKRNANPEKVEILKQELEHKGFKLHLSQGTQTSLIGLIGDTTAIHEDWLKAMDVVEDVRRIREPYKKASRSMHPENTVVDVCGQKMGGGHFQVIAGPCSIETREQITQVAEELTSQLDVELSRFQMIGQDPQFRTLLSRAVTAAKTDATVLIRGENGVGKEGFAKLIHQASPRRNRPFITVNCAAIPEALIESELFGYEEGSFTGARKGGKLGKFELAQGGTLFLDEVGDMPLIMQSKLLRVLQGGEIEKVGREENVAVDVRIVAATNQPLEELIEQRRFRADLYYRLNVVPLSIPPLRERQGDILPLAYHFLDRYNERYQKSAVISRGAAQALLSYDWPGNVRQLQNCIESAVILCGQEEIDPADLSLGTIARPVEAAQPAETRQYGTLREETIRFEGQLLRAVLEQCGGDRDETAHRLGISRRTFYRKWSETQL